MAYTSTEHKALETKRQEQISPHSEIDNLIDMNDLSQWWNSSKNKNIFGNEIAPFADDELLELIMSISTPAAGTISTGKGMFSILKNLFKKSSKSKFPIGYGKPTSRARSQLDNEKALLEELGFTKDGVMTKEAEMLFGIKPSSSSVVTPRKVWK